jgi:hypothetical protein
MTFFYVSRMQVIASPEGDLASYCLAVSMMPFLMGNELHSLQHQVPNSKLGLGINMVGILFHEALAGYSNLHVQVFIIPAS